ncbi:MAG TPA: hypothetical protein VEQ58_04500 [Polyangiaceae bacterium]|nr:hypothetical protein [Polyangiaceae bacterium]
MKVIVILLGLCSAMAWAGRARADVSSWAYVGSGASAFEQRQQKLKVDPTLAIEAGMGTAPSQRIVVGGLVKFQTFFGDGTDLGLALRVASQGFVLGRLGLALDVGGYHRGWGEGSNGGQAALVFGGPWGLTLSVGGGVGSHDARQIGATLGIDFARLTVYRQSGLNWFPNPHPAYRPKD